MYELSWVPMMVMEKASATRVGYPGEVGGAPLWEGGKRLLQAQQQAAMRNKGKACEQRQGCVGGDISGGRTRNFGDTKRKPEAECQEGTEGLTDTAQ